MLNLHQLTTAAIAHATNKDIAFHVKDYNRTCNILTDYMAYTNICFANVEAYLARLQIVSKQFPDALTRALGNSNGDPTKYFHRAIEDIHQMLIKDIYIIADQVRWPIDSDGDLEIEVRYSKSILSIIPGKAILDGNNSALLNKYTNTIGDLPSCNAFDTVMKFYREFGDDPVYGNSKFGILPLVMPFIPTTLEEEAQKKIKYEYVNLYNLARDLFIDTLALSVETTKAISEYNNHEGEDIADRNIKVNVANELEAKLKEQISELSELIYDTLQDIAFSYNDGHTLTLTKVPYVSSNDR